MDAKDLILPDWEKYRPVPLDYYSNIDRQDLLCRFKLAQIYQNFCLARMNCIFSNKNTDYGELDSEGKNKEWLEKMFIQNAIVYYNFCIDLSWQMVFFYCVSKSDEDFNITEEKISEIENNVTFDSLHELLKFQLSIQNQNNELQKLLDLVTEFWTKNLPENFRQDYNYIKHRGTLDIFGISKKENKYPFKFEEHKINITVPDFKTLDVSQYTETLKSFHQLFYKYIESLIEIIVEPNFKPSKYNTKELLENILNNSSTRGND